MIPNLKGYVGRSSVYIESGEACAATVLSVESDAKQMTAAFRIIPEAFRCRLRVLLEPGDDRIEAVLVEAPFGVEWQVGASDKEFCLEDDHWKASFLFGGGFRVFFQTSFVSRFLEGDVTWLDEYYGDDDGDDNDD